VNDREGAHESIGTRARGRSSKRDSSVEIVLRSFPCPLFGFTFQGHHHITGPQASQNQITGHNASESCQSRQCPLLSGCTKVIAPAPLNPSPSPRPLASEPPARPVSPRPDSPSTRKSALSPSAPTSRLDPTIPDVRSTPRGTAQARGDSAIWRVNASSVFCHFSQSHLLSARRLAVLVTVGSSRCGPYTIPADAGGNDDCLDLGLGLPTLGNAFHCSISDTKRSSTTP
jgi:hypothetical protein